MEEEQVLQFVDRATDDVAFRQQVVSNPEAVIRQEGYEEHVARVIRRLVPHLAFETVNLSWWWW